MLSNTEAQVAGHQRLQRLAVGQVAAARLSEASHHAAVGPAEAEVVGRDVQREALAAVVHVVQIASKENLALGQDQWYHFGR